jgi:hypothetical protein
VLAPERLRCQRVPSGTERHDLDATCGQRVKGRLRLATGM